ncbi:hypothetical protein Vadar_023006 [Vaccinium darrowii]|nr:hypothetical protein Vadar_023006 [Vaccinium darrowii]
MGPPFDPIRGGTLTRISNRKHRISSYAQIVKGVSDGNTKVVDGVVAESVWLHNSAVGKLNNTLQDLFISNGIWDAHIRPVGGLNVLVSFDSFELLDTFLKDKDNVLPKWFSFVEAWDDQSFKPSRCVWISCYGVPLKGWCSFTFINIAEVKHENDVSCDFNVPDPLVEKVGLSSLAKKNDMEFEPCNHSTDVGTHFSVSKDVDSFVGESKYSLENEAVDVGAYISDYSIKESNSPLDNNNFLEGSNHVEVYKEATHSEGNIIEDRVGWQPRVLVLTTPNPPILILPIPLLTM